MTRMKNTCLISFSFNVAYFAITELLTVTHITDSKDRSTKLYEKLRLVKQPNRRKYRKKKSSSH